MHKDTRLQNMENNDEWLSLLSDLPLGSNSSGLAIEIKEEDQSVDTDSDKWEDENRFKLSFIKV